MKIYERLVRIMNSYYFRKNSIRTCFNELLIDENYYPDLLKLLQ